MSNANAPAPNHGAPFTHNPALCKAVNKHFADSKQWGRCYIAYIRAMLKGSGHE